MTGLSDTGFAVVGGSVGGNDGDEVGDTDGSGEVVAFVLTGTKV